MSRLLSLVVGDYGGRHRLGDAASGVPRDRVPDIGTEFSGWRCGASHTVRLLVSRGTVGVESGCRVCCVDVVEAWTVTVLRDNFEATKWFVLAC